MKKTIFTILMILSLVFTVGTAYATQGDMFYASSTNPFNVSLPIGSSGKCLTSNGTIPAWGSCGSGGGSSGGTFSTTTSTVSGHLINYPNNSTDVVVIGGSATSSSLFYFDPNLPSANLVGTTSAKCIYDGLACLTFNGKYASYNTGMVLHLPLTEGTGTVAYDRSYLNNNGTLLDSSWQVSKTEPSLYVDFNNSGNYDSSVAVPDSPSIHALANMSASIWFKATSTNATGGLTAVVFGKHAGGTTGEWFLGFPNSATTMRFAVINASASRVNLDGTIPAFDDGKWHNVVGTYNGATMSLYYDGLLLSTASQTGVIQKTTSALCVGSYSNNNSNCVGNSGFTGNLYDARLYNRAMSASEVSELYNDTNPSLPYSISMPIYDSSTIASQFPYASTTMITATTASSSVIYDSLLGTPAGTFIAADRSGKLIATTTPSGSGGVSSVNSSAGTLTCSPTTGNVLCDVDTTHENFWTSTVQHFNDQGISSFAYSSSYGGALAIDQYGDFYYPDGSTMLTDTSNHLHIKGCLDDSSDSCGSMGNVLTNSDGTNALWEAPSGGGGGGGSQWATSTDQTSIYPNVVKKVGIATTTATSTLDVNGSADFEEKSIGAGVSLNFCTANATLSTTTGAVSYGIAWYGAAGCPGASHVLSVSNPASGLIGSTTQSSADAGVNFIWDRGYNPGNSVLSSDTDVFCLTSKLATTTGGLPYILASLCE